MAKSQFLSIFRGLTGEVDEVTKNASATGPHNIHLRQLYSKLELLLLDIEESMIASKSNDSDTVDEKFFTMMQDDLKSLENRLNLLPIERRTSWWRWIDITFRTIGVTTGFITVGVFGSLPIIALRAVDYYLNIEPFSQLSERVKRGVSWLMLELSGISVEIIKHENEKSFNESFSESCSLLTFSHSSNLDGFLVSATCPIRHFALAKKELFMVPFFSWISLAFGGVPVDRGNRDRAVNALKRASMAAKNSQICIVIAPEGTRSSTGQLLPFKKGTFHMWEQLNAPIIPLIFYGAYELYPVNNWVNNTGKVYVRYLDPIGPHEAQSRDEMLRLVRRRMLSKIYIQLSEYIRLLTFILVCMFFTMILILFFLAIEL
mmetsp:Transcript_31905/g.30418  ORF Transcript_31905/g.30418 Transcript_31905/m.30418 type:complete len:375 (-) Transcript_31905:68-1192(-)